MATLEICEISQGFIFEPLLIGDGWGLIMLRLHLGGVGVVHQMQTYANRRGGGLCQYERSHINFLI